MNRCLLPVPLGKTPAVCICQPGFLRCLASQRLVHMELLSAACPTTGKRFSTGIHTDSTTLAKVWFSDIGGKCPHCGEKHAIKIREAYVESVLSSDSMRGVRVV